MRRSLIVLFVLALALPACTRRVEVGSDPNPNPALMNSTAGPAGAYDFAFDMGGQRAEGVMDLTPTAQGIRGTLNLRNVPGEATVRSGTVEGRTVTLELDTPDGPATAELEFDASYDSFTGLVFLGSNAINVTGSRQQ